MSVQRTTAKPSLLRAAARRALFILGVGLIAAIQGCSASRESGDGGSAWKLWGNDSGSASAKSANQPAPRPTSAFDNDGPSANGTYRGGRDPVTGRAQEWGPATPPPAQSTAMAPMPPPAQAAAPYRPATPPAYQQPPYAQQPYPQQASAPAQAGGSSVDVRQGDTLYRIAKTYNVTVPALMQANGLNSESIKVGQRLTIPGR